MTREAPGRPESSPSGEAALTGALGARRLYREIAAHPRAPHRVEVVAPGGYGKTVLLEALASVYARAAVSVRREPPSTDDPPTEPVVLLLDDVHALDEHVLERVRRWMDNPGVGIVLARRPWPRSPALAALSAAIGRHRAPLSLDALDGSGVAERATLLLGERPSPDLVERVAEHTGGWPVLVDRLLVALRDAGDSSWSSTDGPPRSVVQRLTQLVDVQPARVRELLLARAVGAPVDPDILARLLAVEPDAVAGLVEVAQATGLLMADLTVTPLVRLALLRATPEAQVLLVRRRLADTLLDLGGNLLEAARGLVGTGASGSRVAQVLEQAGDQALRECSPDAADLYAAAVAAGASLSGLAARRAEADLLAGDLDGALTHADLVLADPHGAGRDEVARAGTVAAAALAHRGLLVRSAEIYRWLGGRGIDEVALLAIPALIGTGALDEARDILAALDRVSGDRSPTLLAGAAELLARGIYESVGGSPHAALSQLARSAALLEPSGRAALLPDTPAALGALVAIQCGELDVAQSLVDRAVETGLGGRSTLARHRLLQAWIALQRGAASRARTILSAALPPGQRAEPRDEFLAAALEVALARRAGDLAALMSAWSRAREAVVRYPIDLFSLQPLGELLVGAARLREQRWVQPYFAEARTLLDRLGHPALWAAPLHWFALHAALAADAGDEAERHAEALDRAAGAGRHAEAMATSARLWLRVLAGDVDADAVEAAARQLHAVGLTWEGGRLASQAAIRTTDRKAMSMLLNCARSLQAASGSGQASPPAQQAKAERPPSGAAPAHPRETTAPSRTSGVESGDGASGMLSEREREVAELVLAGLTYKQIGERLFISAKTVEHHVARMRQRLGSETRGELFAHLRRLVYGTSSSSS